MQLIGGGTVVGKGDGVSLISIVTLAVGSRIPVGLLVGVGVLLGVGDAFNLLVGDRPSGEAVGILFGDSTDVGTSVGDDCATVGVGDGSDTTGIEIDFGAKNGNVLLYAYVIGSFSFLAVIRPNGSYE